MYLFDDIGFQHFTSELISFNDSLKFLLTRVFTCSWKLATDKSF